MGKTLKKSKEKTKTVEMKVYFETKGKKYGPFSMYVDSKTAKLVITPSKNVEKVKDIVKPTKDGRKTVNSKLSQVTRKNTLKDKIFKYIKAKKIRSYDAKYVKDISKEFDCTIRYARMVLKEYTNK